MIDIRFTMPFWFSTQITRGICCFFAACPYLFTTNRYILKSETQNQLADKSTYLWLETDMEQPGSALRFLWPWPNSQYKKPDEEIYSVKPWYYIPFIFEYRRQRKGSFVVFGIHHAFISFSNGSIVHSPYPWPAESGLVVCSLPPKPMISRCLLFTQVICRYGSCLAMLKRINRSASSCSLVQASSMFSGILEGRLYRHIKGDCFPIQLR